MRVQRSDLNATFEMEVDTKWLTINPETTPPELVVQRQATESLRALGTDPLSLVMIHGQAKTGKSFLMNKLMGQPGYFAVRGGNTPTTVGVDLSPFKPYADLAGSSGSRVTRSGAAPGHVGFLDMEGQGDRGADYDVMLAAPLLLVSKAVVFNWRGKMAKDEMLDKLGVLTRAASQIDPQGNAEGDYCIFGHLHIVLRDQADIEGVHAALFEEEKCAATNKAAMERNTKRKILRESFASCRVWGLPAPIESSSDLSAGRFHEADTTPAFEAALGALKAVLLQQLRESLVLCGRTLSAADVAELVPLLAAAMNAGQDEIVPQSLFRQVEQRRADAAVDAAIGGFDAWEGDVREALPMPPSELDQEVRAQRREGVAGIQERLAGVLGDRASDAWGRFEAHVDKSRAALVLQNDQLIGIKVDAAKAVAFKALGRVAAAEKRQEPVEDEDELQSDFETQAENVLLAFGNALDAFEGGAAVKKGREEVEGKVAATWEAIHRHNQHLVEQQRAAQAKARLEKEKAAAEAAQRKADAAYKAADEQRRKDKAEADARVAKAQEAREKAEALLEKERAAAQEAREKAEALLEKERAAAEAARRTAEEQRKKDKAASAAGGCGGGGGSSGHVSDSTYSGYSSSSSSGGGIGSALGAFAGALFRQPAGTKNANGSTSMGNGYTVDRNGRWHDSTGKFCKAPK